MSNTPILNIEELAAAQAQPELTVNLALRILEAYGQLRILDRDLTTPPGSPSDGDRYIPASGATGAWANHESDVAIYIGTAWAFLEPQPGWIAYVEDEDAYIRFATGSPSNWVPFP